jgi:16S rRNA (guanine1516-N2)-methyltransferase
VPSRLSPIDFVRGPVGYRFSHGGGRKQALAKAAGFSGSSNPLIVDATAGLGRDAFVLASLGSHVTLIERSAKVYALLKEAMEAASSADPKIAEAMSRMTLLYGDAKDLLPTLNADVVIVDPMHPPRRNTALVKQEMRWLREQVGDDLDVGELMQVALSVATKRVVLKLPARADILAGIRKPSHQIIGKSTRFDVYMVEDRSQLVSE